ncbi:hypothetical protein Angca_004268, partial [Angiostrongylus cantonensis]
LLSPIMNQQPLRSQSFKYRARPGADSKKAAIEDVPHERRRSTPTISRRTKICIFRRTTQEVRTDVWPEAKPAIEFDEKFLKLPSSDEYKRQDLLLIIRPDIDLLSIIIKSQIFRVRQFKIDEKGAVVSRGDSFRRKRNDDGVKSDKSPSPYMVSGSDSTRESRSDSVSSSVESRRDTANTVVYPSTSHNNYKIGVVGDTGTGKTSLIGQLITSEYKNAFADEIQDYENTVSICIGGHELDLLFFESDMVYESWIPDEMDAFVVVYSIDSRRSWKQAITAIEMIKQSPSLKSSPILVAGNKADLERKRTVTKNEVRAASMQFGFEHLEISVALDHDVDDLLVSLVAELKEAYTTSTFIEPSPCVEDDFHAAIRRYSQRKKKTVPEDSTAGKCSTISPTCLFNKFKKWRKTSMPKLQT